MKNSILARFARAFFIFWHFVDVLVLSTTWNDQFCRWVDDVSIWWQIFNFVFLCPKRWFQFNSRTVRTQFWSILSLNNWKMIAETRSHIFRWRSRFRRCRVCLNSLKTTRGPPVAPACHAMLCVTLRDENNKNANNDNNNNDNNNNHNAKEKNTIWLRQPYRQNPSICPSFRARW